jgi:valyl-tRNA synthetase
VARFAEPFLADAAPADRGEAHHPVDEWILAALDEVTRQATAAFDQYEYGQARSAIEAFFWRDLADNYLELAKQRLYDAQCAGHASACRTLKTMLMQVLKLFAPILPFITDRLWRALFAGETGQASIHTSAWPEAGAAAAQDAAAQGAAHDAVAFGEHIIAVATAVRRYKSEHALSLGSPLARLEIATQDEALARMLETAVVDLESVTRAQVVRIGQELPAGLCLLTVQDETVQAAVEAVPGQGQA